jgi:AcrR family transcriptional regulator
VEVTEVAAGAAQPAQAAGTAEAAHAAGTAQPAQAAGTAEAAQPAEAAQAVGTVGTVEVDGRRLRRDKNRDAVIDALLALFRDGVYQPSTAEIAARAGLSPRSLFRYFDDVNDLRRAAAARQVLLALPLLKIAATPQDPALVKIRALVRARMRLFEQVGPSARALRASVHRHEVLAAELRNNRAFLCGQLTHLFAPELADPAMDNLPALQVLCSFESYELLRYDQRLSRDATAAALITAIAGLLGIAAQEPA